MDKASVPLSGEITADLINCMKIIRRYAIILICLFSILRIIYYQGWEGILTGKSLTDLLKS